MKSNRQCSFEDGNYYARCTERALPGNSTLDGEDLVYCAKHAQYEPQWCPSCDGETSAFQEAQGTHTHEYTCASCGGLTYREDGICGPTCEAAFRNQ